MEVRNELGVIVIFDEQAKGAGFEIIDIGEAYPDVVIRKNGIEYRAEFEFRAKNFVTHKHDPRRCDVIICWENDFSESVLPIIALSEEGWQDKHLALPTESERELAYWKYRALLAEAKLRQVKRLLPSGDRSQGHFTCPSCERDDFGTIQALNAHRRFCSPVTVNGHNGKR